MNLGFLLEAALFRCYFHVIKFTDVYNSVILVKFTELCNHHPNSFRKLLSPQNDLSCAFAVVPMLHGFQGIGFTFHSRTLGVRWRPERDKPGVQVFPPSLPASMLSITLIFIEPVRPSGLLQAQSKCHS